MSDTGVIRDRAERVRRELEALESRRTRLAIELDVLRDLLKETSGSAEDKVGPAEAVRRLVAERPGITQSDIIEMALSMVTTPPAKARKTIAQTIRNLTDRDIRQEGKSFFPMNGNGHGN